ncbi:MAG: hypothetical protein ACOZDY_10705 [Pseudomonadota bacterium]
MPRSVPWMIIAATGLLAALLRYQLVQPAAIAHVCDAGAGPWWCAVRSLVIATFSTYGLGWAALIAAALALWRRSAGAALAAAAFGVAGLVLYCYEAGAAGFLVGLLVLARAAAGHEDRCGQQQA